jgi:hypothetical protein
MLDKGACLRFYKRQDIQEAILEHALNKEVSVMYGIGKFGKRPDVLMYPRDVLELVKKGATSFHSSEEVWESPLLLNSDLKRKELDELREGWDLVLDIDCPDWELSKLTAHLFIKALKENGVKGISCKFSGNKGFHIGVPFEAFPSEIVGKKTKDLFPEGPKKIAQYLLGTITNNYVEVKNNKIFFDKTYSFSLNELKQKFEGQEFLINRCDGCKKKVKVKDEELTEFVCPKCENRIKTGGNFIKCEKCSILMEKMDISRALCPCGSNNYTAIFDPLTIIEVDTILISSRHLYRMPYSFHEKSGLVSLPIDPDKVMDFEKEMANPDKLLIPMFKFLDRDVEVSGDQLLLSAWDYEVKISEERKVGTPEGFEEIKIESPIKEDFFPPCIKQILTNGVEDGKKRGVFILSNFLGKIGWNMDEIKSYLLAWNKDKNKEGLRDNYIISQLKHFKVGEKLPPNCNNDGYYKDLGVCHPDPLCSRLRNPVNYTLIRWKTHLKQKELQEKEDAKAERKKVREEAKEKAQVRKEAKVKEEEKMKETNVENDDQIKKKVEGNN